MKRINLIFVFMLMCFSAVSAQEKEHKLDKAEKKEIRKSYQAAVFEEVKRAVDERRFIVEADKISLKNGKSCFINPRTNFISLDGEDAILQLSPNNSALMGPNGLGGITLKGKASDVKITTTKKGNINISMAIQGVSLSSQVRITIPKGGNNAIVTVSPTFSGYKYTLKGIVMSIDNTTTFKGRVTP